MPGEQPLHLTPESRESQTRQIFFKPGARSARDAFGDEVENPPSRHERLLRYVDLSYDPGEFGVRDANRGRERNLPFRDLVAHAIEIGQRTAALGRPLERLRRRPTEVHIPSHDARVVLLQVQPLDADLRI